MPGTHQHGAAEGVALAHSIYGEPVTGTRGIAAGGDIQPAGLHSTLPYKKPKRRGRDNSDKPLCDSDGCGAWPMKATGYCYMHSKSMGLLEKKVTDDDAD